ncbi:MAG: regulator of sirC expression with transglutaminase-like and TPR domain [Bacteroidia bacterium]|jgi:regulator of sirC expression with transglutaminase-like and TPR domain
MIDEKELQSMLYLLDDSDERIVEQIETKILSLGLDVVPILERQWPIEESTTRQERMIELIKIINQNTLVNSLEKWLDTEEQDLMEGLLIINKIVNPNVDRKVIDKMLDKIKLDAWLEMNYDLTSFEKVKILNHIIFDVHGFKGDAENYHHSRNSFLSSVLERKIGNPVSLAIIYSLVAQRLNIPIYGVNLPQHFILGYVRDFDFGPLLRFNDEPDLPGTAGSDILFYINPFNNGLIFNHDNIHKFLTQLKLEPKQDYFKVCTNKDIVLRVLTNLEVSFSKEKKQHKLEQVVQLLRVLKTAT